MDAERTGSFNTNYPQLYACIFNMSGSPLRKEMMEYQDLTPKEVALYEFWLTICSEPVLAMNQLSEALKKCLEAQVTLIDVAQLVSLEEERRNRQ